MPNETFACRDANCHDISHNDRIFTFYDFIISAIYCVEEIFCKTHGTAREVSRPGWNEFIKDFQHHSCDAFQLQRDYGCPRHRPIFELKRKARARYEYATRFIKDHEVNLIKNTISEKHINKNSNDFWKNIRKTRKSRQLMQLQLKKLRVKKYSRYKKDSL